MPKRIVGNEGSPEHNIVMCIVIVYQNYKVDAMVQNKTRSKQHN
jgi:hypothetical protein